LEEVYLFWSIFPWRKRATLYVHFPCFDGVISGVVATLALERSRRWKFKTILPVNYDLQRDWLSASLPRHTAVVDFLFHPQAEFWVDHHPTSFLTPELQTRFEQRKDANWIYDRSSGSCASLLWRTVAHSLHGDQRLEEMVHWAEKIDSAAYTSVEEAFSTAHPALVLSKSLAVKSDAEYCRFLITTLRAASLEEAIRLPEVQTRFVCAQERSAAGLERARQETRLIGDVAVLEVENDGVMISRYSPYYFYPQARYSIMTSRSTHGTKITAMRNPWLDFESIELGRFMRQFGGGGHQRVGSVVLPEGEEDKAPQIVAQLLKEMTSQKQLM
jgi:hypothetical protein